ncbi:GNAT family N-acetyltransferase [Streptomyces resistomycificus]|uniref:GNAT family acetyltransferase n=1 Tax=Streptomyces resistomycificus TaxID=67356 RepID=A0A0L8LXI0_9ACTN|nr:GNAT family N-acetyltransferase [Streptomyces resistomycificus]KOG42887.1 GNAT family acetyltransferase [Streptomyces resistomycificus]KUO01490.1 GNAT family acetyltransferase [Streptomyces resistomycificus]
METQDIRVEVARAADRELVDAFDRMLPQLSSTAARLDLVALDRILRCDANTLLVARSGEAVVGTMTFVVFPVPSGLRARIEDVVVDHEARGRGIAGLLTHEALRPAAEAGARTVDLTSRPDRTAANRLYERLGFKARGSTVYRVPLKG